MIGGGAGDWIAEALPRLSRTPERTRAPEAASQAAACHS